MEEVKKTTSQWVRRVKNAFTPKSQQKTDQVAQKAIDKRRKSATLIKKTIKGDPRLKQLRRSDSALIDLILPKNTVDNSDRSKTEKTDPLLVIVATSRIIELLKQDTKDISNKEELEQLGDTFKKAIENRRGEIVATHATTSLKWAKSSNAENITDLSALRMKCQILELDQLTAPDKQDGYSKERSELVKQFQDVRKTLTESKFCDEEGTIVTQFDAEIAEMLEVDADIEHNRYAQVQSTKWEMQITKQKIEELQSLLESAHSNWARKAIEMISKYRFFHLEYLLRKQTMVGLQKCHEQLEDVLADSPKDLEDDDWLKQLKNAILCYREFGEGKQPDYKILRSLCWLDQALLSDFDSSQNRLEKILPTHQLKGDISTAVQHLGTRVNLAETPERQVNETLTQTFEADYIKNSRRSVDFAFYNGEDCIATFPVRVGTKSGQRLLDALTLIANDDNSLLRALQICVSQCADSAFLQAALSDINSVRLEKLSYTIRKRDKIVTVSIAGRVIIPDFVHIHNGGDVETLAYQTLTVTFCLEPREKGWLVKSGQVDRRDPLEWVTHVPTLTPEKDDSQATENPTFYVQRQKPVMDDETITSLYWQPKNEDDLIRAIELLSKEEIDEILEKARLSPVGQLHRMIEAATEKEIESLTLEDEKRVISLEINGLGLCKLASGKVTFKDGTTKYFPYIEENGKLQRLFLCDKPYHPKV